MDTHKVEIGLIVVLAVLLAGAAIYGLMDKEQTDNTDELEKQIWELQNDLEWTEAMLDRYDGITACNVWFEGEGFYRIYCGDNFISEFRNATSEDRTMVTIPICWKDYPGNTFTVDVYKDGQFARSVTFDVDYLKEQQDFATVDTIDMSGY